MNDYQMRFLGDDRRDRLLAEAERERRARALPVAPRRNRVRRLPSRPSSFRLLAGRLL